MLSKSLEKIVLSDLETLVQNSVSEGKSLEYKLTIPGGTDKDKKEFLADASSFANTSGGDLIYGIKEKNGVAVSVEGIPDTNSDELIRKYDNLIRDGIEPRIQATIHKVTINKNRILLIIRISKGWIGPHRVTFQGHDKFYARNSAGKYPLDVSELRLAFNLSDTITEKIRRFRVERISSIIDNNTPVPLREGGKFILHFIPLESFSPNVGVDLGLIKVNPHKLHPICSAGLNWRINIDGFLVYSGETNGIHSYVQLYRNGIIEAVEGLMLSADKIKTIPSIKYERELLKSLPLYLRTLKDLYINTPIFISLTATGIKGYKMAVQRSIYLDNDDGYPIDREILVLPEALIETYDVTPEEILRPLFDLLWNTCGFERSPNFDQNGHWKVE